MNYTVIQEGTSVHICVSDWRTLSNILRTDDAVIIQRGQDDLQRTILFVKSTEELLVRFHNISTENRINGILCGKYPVRTEIET